MRIYRKTLPSKITEKAVELVADHAKSLDSRAYIFCESKATLSYESLIAEKFGGSFSIEVTSFSRYVTKRTGGFNYLGKSASALVIADILAKNRSKLARLKTSNYTTATSVYELIEQLKAAKITPLDLDGIISAERTALSYKLSDIRLVYSEYENYLAENGLTDDGMVLSLMPGLLRADESMKGAKVVVAGINNFTRQSVDIVVALEKFCDLDCVLLSYDGDSAVNESFYKLLSIFPEAVVFDDECVYSRPVEILKERLFAPAKYRVKGEFCNEVSVVEAADALEEAEFVAKTIRTAIFKEGKRFKDFAVACPDVNVFAPVFKKAFDDYGVALYADAKRTLNTHPVVSLLNSLVELKRKNCRSDTALALSKNALFIGGESASAFEDYIYKFAVPRYGIVKEFSDEIAESVRNKIVLCYNKMLANGLIGQHIASIKAIFDYLNVERKLEELCEKLIENGEDVLSDFAKKGYDCFLEVLNETERLLSDRTLDITEFRDLILSSCAGLEISLLPRYNDCVFMGDYRSTRIRRAKVLFCVGLTGDTPFFKSDDALLSDRELARMEGFRLVVEPKISIVNKREIENVATTLMSFDEKLYATYPLLSVKGEKAGKGQVVDDIIRAFTSDGKSPFLSLEGERATRSAEGVEGYLSKGAGIKNYFKAIEAFKNKTIDDLTAAGSFLKALSKSDKALYSYALSAGKGTELIREGLSYSGGLSASLVESYFSCPYSAFGSKILGLKERESGEIKPKEYGVFIHAVLEKFALVCDSLKETEVEATAKKIVNEVAGREEYARYNEKKRFAFGLAEAKAEAIKECVRIYRMQKRSDFRVFGTEIRFGDDQKAVLPPVLVSTPFGDKKISGYIDRMDVCENAKGEKLARVIDYKTGSSVKNKADVSNLYTGRNVQLYLYLNAVKNGGYEPAGAHYYASNDDFIDKGSERRTFYGAMLFDEDVLSSMDHSLTGGGKSADYGVDAKKSGKDLLDERAMQGLIEYAKLVTEMGAEEMAKGCFAPSPMTGACTYCAMRGACRFDGDEPSLSREEIKADDEKIIKAVEEANDEKN